MKKLFFLSIIAIFAFQGVNAQGQFRAGVNAGLPVGDFGDLSTFAIAVDLGYLFDLSDDLDAGIETGYTNFFGKDGFDGFSFIPINGLINYDLSEEIEIEGGAGYAISLESGGGGDFYWKIGGAYAIDEDSDIGLSYRSVSGGNGFSIDAIYLGYRRRF
ncbi:hypothetical protein EYD45_02580 [Hyunsoonleella flava]|uniref:Outer membrane protein beta-barrel domain-containing protein n=1 Tax=Hyunsoonleella flava TaxID=2527939 RepID=A0A4Q9FLY9_9FLAO|nr:hypothetical protein [Hyunsoonleella flava]TBN06790.1 hypothetical protein EYD45_02580 [Hyunsoonleella flava]